MNINIKTFAVLKEELGESINIEINENSKVEDLLNLLKEQYPNASGIFDSSRIATANSILEDQNIVPLNEELFILPPSSGG